MRKVIAVLGAGPTSAHFQRKNTYDYVIGVNDAGKFGHEMDALLFLNAMRQFTPDRQQTITSTRVSKAICISNVIADFTPYWPTELIRTEALPHPDYFDPKKIYHTDNSPFAAMCYAFAVMGATDVVLWGVDFIDHKFLRFESSAPPFTKYDKLIRKSGGKVWRGHRDMRLVLELWQEPEL